MRCGVICQANVPCKFHHETLRDLAIILRDVDGHIRQEAVRLGDSVLNRLPYPGDLRHQISWLMDAIDDLNATNDSPTSDKLGKDLLTWLQEL